jgi:hypothetical protein
MEKTTMQEFIELLYRNYPESNLGFDWNYFKEREKQQILDAYKQGVDDWVIEDVSLKTKNKSSEKYYNETYKTVSK